MYPASVPTIAQQLDAKGLTWTAYMSASPIPTRGFAFGYAMNHVVPRWQSSRNRVLVDAVYASLGAA